MTETKKRKTHTSTAVKDRWNAAHYKQWTGRLKPELYDKIESYIQSEGISKPEFLARAIEALTK